MVASGNSCVDRPRLVERGIGPKGNDSVQLTVEA
jgi:hypothetical protein